VITTPIILASRSPRRRELLSQLVDPSRIHVLPPASSDEPGFEDCRNFNDVDRRIREIARTKRIAVRESLRAASDPLDPNLGATAAILAADTTIVAESAAGRMEVLGQPPPEDASRPTVRRWFEEFYFARPHVALTAVSIERSDGQVAECVAITTISFSRARADWLDWYLATDEPDGKAGGYAVQGLASVFIDRIEGSLTNVIGLPLAETRQLLLDLRLA
jgi:septum formation protein